MATDRAPPHRVAWLVLLLGCGPAVQLEKPRAEPDPVARLDKPRPQVSGGRQVLVGEMCPLAAGGRPAIAPLVMRSGTWTDAQVELANAVERGSTPRFAVFGVDGKVAGAFDTMGLADLGISQQAASGTYTGGLPCTADAGGGARAEDPQCGPATGGCGLAVAELTRPDDPPAIPAYRIGGACVAGDALAIDIDGDGAPELFPLAAVLDGARGPSLEWTSSPAATGACKPTFVVYGVNLTPVIEPGKPIDPKQTVGLDVLGVADLDGDGRMELVIALKFPTVRTIAVYTAASSARRLELAGEGQSFPR